MSELNVLTVDGFARFVVSLDDPTDLEAVEARRTITLSKLIDMAQRALIAEPDVLAAHLEAAEPAESTSEPMPSGNTPAVRLAEFLAAHDTINDGAERDSVYVVVTTTGKRTLSAADLESVLTERSELERLRAELAEAKRENDGLLVQRESWWATVHRQYRVVEAERDAAVARLGDLEK